MKNIFGNGGRKVNPHGKHADPGKKLHQTEFPHAAGQMKNQREDLTETKGPVKLSCANGGQFGIARRIFLGGKNGPQHGSKQGHGANIE